MGADKELVRMRIFVMQGATTDTRATRVESGYD
jgi:hypothetical protein